MRGIQPLETRIWKQKAMLTVSVAIGTTNEEQGVRISQII